MTSNVVGLDVYYKNDKIGTFKIPANSPETTGAFSKDLVFFPTATSLGLRYIFTLQPIDLDMDTYFQDSLYYFILIDEFGNQLVDLTGLVVDRQIRCCIAKKLNNSIKECNGCMNVKDLKEINTIHAYLIGAKSAIRTLNPSLTMCALNIIEEICSNCSC